jgi:hypothetical protein
MLKPAASRQARLKPAHVETSPMDTLIVVFLLALPFLVVGGLVAILTYFLGTPTVRKRRT